MTLRRRRSPVPAPAPVVSALNQGEVQWRDKQLQIAQILAERYTSGGHSLPGLDVLDEIVIGWLDDNESRVEVNIVINGVGIAFGQHLVQDAGLAWVIATDANGSDLAVHREEGSVLVYPANAVAKRIVTAQRHFVVPLHQAMVADIRSLPAGK